MFLFPDSTLPWKQNVFLFSFSGNGNVFLFPH
jgi:hypothetical protein